MPGRPSGGGLSFLRAVQGALAANRFKEAQRLKLKFKRKRRQSQESQEDISELPALTEEGAGMKRDASKQKLRKASILRRSRHMEKDAAAAAQGSVKQRDDMKAVK